MFKRAIVRAPSANFADGLTTVDLGRPNYERALEQHEAYCAALEQRGLSLLRLDADERHPDATFVEDTAVLTKRCAVLTRPGAPSRAGEVASIRKALADFYTELHTLATPGTVDGGDVCEAGNHFFIGISARTNEAGAKQLARLFAKFDYTSSLVDIRNVREILHLKSGLAYLGDGRLVIIEALRTRAEFQSFDLICAPVGEEYAANCLRVNDDVLIAAGHSKFQGVLEARSYQTIALEMSEFQKMDGGLSCLSLRF